MELPDEDQPPEHIWLNSEEVSAHFKAVMQRHKSGGGGAEEVPQAPLEQNELTRGLFDGG